MPTGVDASLDFCHILLCEFWLSVFCVHVISSIKHFLTSPMLFPDHQTYYIENKLNSRPYLVLKYSLNKAVLIFLWQLNYGFPFEPVRLYILANSVDISLLEILFVRSTLSFPPIDPIV